MQKRAIYPRFFPRHAICFRKRSTDQRSDWTLIGQSRSRSDSVLLGDSAKNVEGVSHLRGPGRPEDRT